VNTVIWFRLFATTSYFKSYW